MHGEFIEMLWDYYGRHGRGDLPWREPRPDGSFDPYRILVSELMLQQTQVGRVLPKFEAFLTRFPTLQSLADAELGDVLTMWSGLGYNRRAKFLWQAAHLVMTERGGAFPATAADLVRLPGVGHNTAGAIMAYAFNEPVLFVETNVRTVYIHHFFADADAVPDTDILEVLTQTLDHEHPREFYWALMDYGSHLKRSVGNLSRQSKGYAKQSAFAGSRRQVRGQVLRALGDGPRTLVELETIITDNRLPAVLVDLVSESLIRKMGDSYQL